ncbi:MAG: MlaE family lipid ABC transporter permease subunit [Pseudorhodoplanes sp.]|nr:MlaE family lipid ABC transporter permease subunit [Pseudorhodoplanes sp.]
MVADPTLGITVDNIRLELRPAGTWTTAHVHTLEALLSPARPQALAARAVAVDMAGILELDTLGAWLLEKFMRGCSAQGVEVQLHGLPDRYRGLLEQIRRINRQKAEPPKGENAAVVALEAVGRGASVVKAEVVALLEMLAALSFAVARALIRPQSFRFTSMVHHLYRVCWQAIPIMFLITFLIGCIIAQQGIFHFRKFGADAYVVDMVGILVLREIGVLIVSIMVAGRSGSAYTAELGSMKMREEIDALRTMGFDPIDVLILPRVLALVIALPILAFLGSLAALYGGGLVAWLYGGMSPDIFIARLREAVSVTHFEVGMIKAPFMALVIGLVASSAGLRVKGSAESLGLQTTSSVVASIFLVIVLDGAFAIFFASIGM